MDNLVPSGDHFLILSCDYFLVEYINHIKKIFATPRLKKWLAGFPESGDLLEGGEIFIARLV